MLRIVLDSTVLVSAFLTAGGAADAVMQRARDGLVLVYASEEILDETRKVLAYPRLVERHRYTGQEVQAFYARVRDAVLQVSPLPPLPAICRDPHDDMVLACAVAAAVQYRKPRQNILYTSAEINRLYSVRCAVTLHVIWRSFSHFIWRSRLLCRAWMLCGHSGQLCRK